jgi:hypothetical protein
MLEYDALPKRWVVGVFYWLGLCKVRGWMHSICGGLT